MIRRSGLGAAFKLERPELTDIVRPFQFDGSLFEPNII